MIKRGVLAGAAGVGLLFPGLAEAAGLSWASRSATPPITISISSPRAGASYQRGSRILARFGCSEGGHASAIASCQGTVPRGHPINTSSASPERFTFRVTAVDKSGNRSQKTVQYTVWEYTNPMQAIQGLGTGRIDMGVDYSGSGPILALGAGKVIRASNHDAGPESCWGKTCWPGGGIVIYRLADGPFAGKFVYVAENITVSVSEGQHVTAGQQIATLRNAFPNMETGWASGQASETLAFADHHECTCRDPGGWSSIEGRNFNQLLVVLDAPPGSLQSSVPQQSMPPGWPTATRVRRR